MAKLTNQRSGEAIYLLPYHAIGRRKDYVDTLVEEATISSIHAVIEWHENHWTLKNLSRNGVLLNGNKIERLTPTALEAGSIISLPTATPYTLLVNDTAPPSPMLIPLNASQNPLLLDLYNILPNEHSPELILFYDSIDKRWKRQSLSHTNTDVVFELAHGESLTLGNQSWRTFLPVSHTHTAEIVQEHALKGNLTMAFSVSLNEENVAVSFEFGGQVVDLGYKTYFYLLLYLARRCISDARAGLGRGDTGWTSSRVITSELGIDELLVNTYVYRARKLLSRHLPQPFNPPNLIERRPGELRLNISASEIKIVKGTSA